MSYKFALKIRHNFSYGEFYYKQDFDEFISR